MKIRRMRRKARGLLGLATPTGVKHAPDRLPVEPVTPTPESLAPVEAARSLNHVERRLGSAINELAQVEARLEWTRAAEERLADGRADDLPAAPEAPTAAEGGASSVNVPAPSTKASPTGAPRRRRPRFTRPSGVPDDALRHSSTHPETAAGAGALFEWDESARRRPRGNAPRDDATSG